MVHYKNILLKYFCNNYFIILIFYYLLHLKFYKNKIENFLINILLKYKNNK